MFAIIAELVSRTKNRSEYTETFWCPYFQGFIEHCRLAEDSIWAQLDASNQPRYRYGGVHQPRMRSSGNCTLASVQGPF
jgi:hypothetical protein